MAVKLFVDFDGTITCDDVGNAFFIAFGGEQCKAYINQYRSGRRSAKELFRLEVEALGRLDTQRAVEFFHKQEIDQAFKRFVEFCSAYRLEWHIVSDGLDFYISEILRYNGIRQFSAFSDRLNLTDNGRPTIEFPFDDAECTRCACCKRNVLATQTSDDDVIVYIGEGYSDRCPSRYADIVFAKGELQRFCQEENISYYLYQDFDDVIARLRTILQRKRIKQRREAMIARRNLFISEV